MRKIMLLCTMFVSLFARGAHRQLVSSSARIFKRSFCSSSASYVTEQNINLQAMLAVPRAALVCAMQSRVITHQMRTLACCNNAGDNGEKRIDAFGRVTATLIEGFGLKGIAELEHAKRFEQELRTACENNCSNIHCDVHIDWVGRLSHHLEQAADLDMSLCAQVILNYAREREAKLRGSALSLARSEEVADRLITSGMFDVHDHSSDFSALHTVPNNVIPCLLRHNANVQTGPFSKIGYSYAIGSDEQILNEATWSGLTYVAKKNLGSIHGSLCRGLRVKRLNKGCTEIYYHIWKHVEPLEQYRSLRSLESLTEAFKGVFSKEELIENIKKHSFVWEWGPRDESVTEYLLHQSPVAAAIVMRDPERLQLFFEHASRQAIIPQIEKLQFIAKWLPAFLPSSKIDYRILGDMVNDYARGHSSRVIESI